MPREAQYVAHDCARRGPGGIPAWNFHLAFGLFRFSATLPGVLKRALDGTAHTPKAVEYGAPAAPLAEPTVTLTARPSAAPPVLPTDNADPQSDH